MIIFSLTSTILLVIRDNTVFLQALKANLSDSMNFPTDNVIVSSIIRDMDSSGIMGEEAVMSQTFSQGKTG